MPSVQQLAMSQPGMQQYSGGLAPQKQRSGIGQFFLGKQQQYNQVPTQTPQAMQALQQLLGGGMQGLQNPYQGFDPIQEQFQKQFETQTVPGLAERFTALGSGGSQNSSAFQGALGSAGAGLSGDLAALKSQYGLQNRNSLLNQLQLGLTPQFETVNEPGTKGFLQSLLEAIGGGVSDFSRAYGSELGSRSAGGSGSGGLDIAKLLKLLSAGV